MLDDILKSKGLKYTDLTPEEKDTYQEMSEALSNAQITPDKLKEHIQKMKDSVEEALVEEPEFKWFIPNRRHIYLKARLKNYLLLEGFLGQPEKVKRMIQIAMKGK